MTKTRKRKIYGGLECIPDYDDENTFEMRSFLYRLTPEKQYYCDYEKGCNAYVPVAQNLIEFLVNFIDKNFKTAIVDKDYTDLWITWNAHIDTNFAKMSLKK
jgi:hypothetical protein